MPKEQTEKSRYPSKYSPGAFVSSAQYILEKICENKALIEGKTLPMRFWELKEWATYFVSQTKEANKLLKKYSVESIIRALDSWQGKKIYSLRAPHLEKLIKSEDKKFKEQKEKFDAAPKKIVQPKEATPRKPLSSKSMIDKLRELENE